MHTPSTKRYKNHCFPAESISHGVWLSFRFCLGYRDIEELIFARGVTVTYEAIMKPTTVEAVSSMLCQHLWESCDPQMQRTYGM